MRTGTVFSIRFSLVALLVISLQGCLDMATTGAQAVYNRQSLQKNFSDQYTTMQAYKTLNFKTDEFADANITIATFNGEVLLAGQVPQAWQKVSAEKMVRQKLPDVERIYNLIQVGSPSSSLTRISDAWITSKVKAKMLASNDVDATKIKVVTENGTVYLMGLVMQDEADAAVDLARNTDGVQSVVKIFTYLQVVRKNPGHSLPETKKQIPL